ncbi:GntR family transcriptional regulator [Corynebacterium sp. AOP40-9SA-29]|uniref:GntR family transcriptional regulator n=1 Tax=Corynebacterium sp. AOP40-9SA-29 TaxID=3457677 RepID=UPI0040332D2D
MRAQSASTRLRHAVSAGEYAPGAKLNEVVLAQQLGVSRNTLRESFATLAADGIIDRIPNRGVFIASPTAEDIGDLYRERAVIEPAALLWGEMLDAAALDQVVSDAERHLALGNLTELGLANQQFHRTVVTAAGSRLLDQEMDRLLARMRLVFLLAERADPEFHRPFVATNRQIVTLLQAGDRPGAASALRTSITDTGHSLPSLIARR